MVFKALIGAVKSAIETGINGFKIVRAKANISGKLLACALALRVPFKTQTVTLIGHSLGSQVIKSCLKTLDNIYKTLPATRLRRFLATSFRMWWCLQVLLTSTITRAFSMSEECVLTHRPDAMRQRRSTTESLRTSSTAKHSMFTQSLTVFYCYSSLQLNGLHIRSAATTLRFSITKIVPARSISDMARTLLKVMMRPIMTVREILDTRTIVARIMPNCKKAYLKTSALDERSKH